VAAAPDLLQRFVATPAATRRQIGEISISVLSNDESIVAAVEAITSKEAGRASQKWSCKLVRDREAPIASEVEICYHHHGLEVLCLLSGTQFVIDHDSLEVFGFIAPAEEPGPLAARLVEIIRGAALHNYH